MALEVQPNQHHHHQTHLVDHHHHQSSPITLDLFGCELSSSSSVDLDEPSPLPFGWQKFLNLKTGEIYYTQNKMSRRNNGKSPKLDLKLNLSPPKPSTTTNPYHVESSTTNRSVSPTSPISSCVSSENNSDDLLRYSNSPEATSMVLVGCPRCLMYVMLSEDDPKCPKCKSSVLLDFVNENHTKKTRKP